MPDCCTSILDIGCYESCDNIQIFASGSTGAPVTATQTGTHTIRLTTYREIATFALTAGDPVVFSNPFNEDSCSVFQVIQPDGSLLTVNSNDCFTVEVSPPNNPSLASVTIDCGEVSIVNGCTSVEITTISCPGTYTVPCITDINGGSASVVPNVIGVVDGCTP